MCMDEVEELIRSSLKGTQVMRLSGITSLMGVGLLLASSALVAAPQSNQDSQSKDQTTTSQEHRKHNKKRGKHDKKMNKKQGETQASPAPQQ